MTRPQYKLMTRRTHEKGNPRHTVKYSTGVSNWSYDLAEIQRQYVERISESPLDDFFIVKLETILEHKGDAP